MNSLKENPATVTSTCVSYTPGAESLLHHLLDLRSWTSHLFQALLFSYLKWEWYYLIRRVFILCWICGRHFIFNPHYSVTNKAVLLRKWRLFLQSENLDLRVKKPILYHTAPMWWRQYGSPGLNLITLFWCLCMFIKNPALYLPLGVELP